MTFEGVLNVFQVLAGGDGGGPFDHGELAVAVALCTLAGAIVVLRSSARHSRAYFYLALLPVVTMLLSPCGNR